MWAQIDIPPLEVFGAGALALSILLWLVWVQRQDAKELKKQHEKRVAALEEQNRQWVTRTIDQFVPLVTESNALLRQSTDTVIRQQELLVELREQLTAVSRDLHEFEVRIARDVATRS